MQRTVHVCLNEQSSPILCKVEDVEVEVNDFCVFQDQEGAEHTGYLNNFVYLCERQLADREMPTILRRANSSDVRAWHFLKRREIEALVSCKEKTLKHKLTMKISDVKFVDRQHKVIFFFTADKRVDFRELVKDLASTFHARIELWQVGVRDESKSLGGLGCCGLQMCCCRWMREFMPVSIRFAKAQDIQFSPTKLSGICGRLRCCLAYEQQQYQEMGKGVPPIGALTESERYGETKVADRNLLTRTLSIYDKDGKSQTIFLDKVHCRKEKVDEKRGAKGQVIWKIEDVVEEDEELFAEPEPKTVRIPSLRDGVLEILPDSRSDEPPKRKSRDSQQPSFRPKDSRSRGPSEDREKAARPAAKAAPSRREGGEEKEKPSRPRRRRRGRRRRGDPEKAKQSASNRTAVPGSPQKPKRDRSSGKGDGKGSDKPAGPRKDRGRRGRGSGRSSPQNSRK